ncbi:outer membrane beta-barrel family protein [Aquimarina algiphila]|uniref:outer membrane beta-barrel family protein n=1 Tax=Aquimarina algiphila TaxID=2047982 RepID=UPI00232CEDFD|nr:TonB-dependent receptor [Aquimarina algiphila]
MALLYFISYSTYSQTEIKGTVKDSLNGAVEFANVVLTNNNNEIITGDVTDKNGNFILYAREGKYKLNVSFLGFKNWTKDLDVTGKTELRDIVLIEDSSTLKEVVIIAKKKLIEHKVDRLVFNVGESIAASGGDAVDILKITPRLRIDNDQISMIGKSGMALMVDDRLMQLSNEDLVVFLRSIRSDDIESIEVITNPPAKYDAEGNSGIVNIKLKKIKKDNWNVTLRTQYQQSSYSTGASSGRFNYKKNKFSFSSGISYVNGSNKRTERDEIFYPDREWITDFNKRPFTNSLAGKLLADYTINKRWSIGVQYYFSNNLPHTKEEDTGVITDVATNQINSLIVTQARNDKHNQLNNLNLYSKIKLDTVGRTLSVDLVYFDYKNDNNRNFNTNTFLPDNTPTAFGMTTTLTDGDQKIKNYAGVVDIEHPSKWIDLNYGFKISTINTKNDINFFDISTGTPIINQNQSNVFEFDENTQAVYLSGEKKINDKWSVKAGVRLESTQTEGYSQTINQTNKNRYTELFPTFYLSYNPNENHSFSFDYGRRIKRPNYSSLNPFRFFSSPFSYNEGNPFLRPQFSNILEFQYGYKGKLYTTLSFINETQGFGEVPVVNSDDNIQYFTYLNYFKYNAIDFSQSYSFNAIQWWESYNSINVYYSASQLDDTVNLEDTDGWGAYFSSNNSFLFNKSKTIRGELNFWYQTPENDLLYKIDSKYSVDLGLRFSLLKSKNLQLSITASDIFRTNENRQKTFANDIKQVYSNYGDNRRVKLTASYFFGSRKVRYKRKNFGNESEKNRTDTN